MLEKESFKLDSKRGRGPGKNVKMECFLWIVGKGRLHQDSYNKY